MVYERPLPVALLRLRARAVLLAQHLKSTCRTSNGCEGQQSQHLHSSGSWLAAAKLNRTPGTITEGAAVVGRAPPVAVAPAAFAAKPGLAAFKAVDEASCWIDGTRRRSELAAAYQAAGGAPQAYGRACSNDKLNFVHALDCTCLCGYRFTQGSGSGPGSMSISWSGSVLSAAQLSPCSNCTCCFEHGKSNVAHVGKVGESSRCGTSPQAYGAHLLVEMWAVWHGTRLRCWSRAGDADVCAPVGLSEIVEADAPLCKRSHRT